MQGSCSKINMQVESLVGIVTDGASANIAAAGMKVW